MGDRTFVVQWEVVERKERMESQGVKVRMWLISSGGRERRGMVGWGENVGREIGDLLGWGKLIVRMVGMSRAGWWGRKGGA